MENKRSQSKTFGGLVRKVVAPLVVGAAALMPMQKADGGYIEATADGFSGVSGTNVRLYHLEGAHDDYISGEDTIYSTTARAPPRIDFFSEVGSYDLSKDKRGLDSTSTFDLLLQGNGLTSLTNGNLSFLIDTMSDFGNYPLLADIYKNDELIYHNLDIKDYIDTDGNSNGKSIDLSLSNNSTDHYNIIVGVPEPSTLAMLGAGALAVGAGYLASRRKKE